MPSQEASYTRFARGTSLEEEDDSWRLTGARYRRRLGIHANCQINKKRDLAPDEIAPLGLQSGNLNNNSSSRVDRRFSTKAASFDPKIRSAVGRYRYRESLTSAEEECCTFIILSTASKFTIAADPIRRCFHFPPSSRPSSLWTIGRRTSLARAQSAWA